MAAVAIALVVLLVTTGAVLAASDDSIEVVDASGSVGDFPSLVLDDAGNPVIAYRSSTGLDLKLLRCNDPNCSGGDDLMTSPDTAGAVGTFASLALDAAGNPVVAYADVTNDTLRLLHCNDPSCTGSDESIESPGAVGFYASLTLDSAGNPVVSYADDASGGLQLLHCNDPNCADGDDSITNPVPTTVVRSTSLALDSAGNPVIAFGSGTPSELGLLHCNDPDCAGGDDSITHPDVSGDVVGIAVSLVLDAAGNPVVAYYDSTNRDLKLLHCNDPDCAGGDDSITSPDGVDNVGLDASLALDSAGNPVVAYLDSTNRDLKLLHCNDPDCAGGDDSITSPDGSDDDAGSYASLALDSAGNPVVAYYAGLPNNDLRLLHCDDPNCQDNTPPALDGVPDEVTVEATGPDGAVVDYALPTATDGDDPDPLVACDPPPQTTFPVGDTTVTCTATDDTGNVATARFTVSVSALAPPTSPGPTPDPSSSASEPTVPAPTASAAPVSTGEPPAADAHLPTTGATILGLLLLGLALAGVGTATLHKVDQAAITRASPRPD